MAKGYWIANVDVRDDEGYKEYVAMLPDIFSKYGGRYTTRGGRTEAVEGKSRSRIVVIEFPNYEAALACYRSPEYPRPSCCARRPRTPISSDRRLRRPAAVTFRPPPLAGRGSGRGRFSVQQFPRPLRGDLPRKRGR